MARRCGVYVRISNDPEGLEAGVRRQEKDARALAEARGWEVVGVYSDNDISASTGRKRPAWERLLKDLADRGARILRGIEMTSYDYNWQNDMKCVRPDGSSFYTDYAGARRYEAGQ